MLVVLWEGLVTGFEFNFLLFTLMVAKAIVYHVIAKVNVRTNQSNFFQESTAAGGDS